MAFQNVGFEYEADKIVLQGISFTAEPGQRIGIANRWLLGPVLDSFRAASIHKNLHSLHIRMMQHSLNAQYLSENLRDLGLTIHYPGLEENSQHELMTELMDSDFGYGGMLTIDMGTKEKGNELMSRMQEAKVGYLAVSLGFYKTLFSAPGSSTSSEIPEEEQAEMGLSQGLVRFSMGLDHDIEHTFQRIKHCLEEMGALETVAA